MDFTMLQPCPEQDWSMHFYNAPALSKTEHAFFHDAPALSKAGAWICMDFYNAPALSKQGWSLHFYDAPALSEAGVCIFTMLRH